MEVCLTVDFDDRDAVGDVLGLNREYDVFDAVRPFHASSIAAHARVVVPRGRPAQTLAYSRAVARTIEPRLRPRAQLRLRVTARCSCAFVIFERPLMPRSLASS